MRKVGVECGAPVSMTGGKGMFVAADDLAFKVGREGRVVVGEA